LDTSGEALRRGVAARPDIIKPNADELAELTGSHEPLRATQDARRRGAGAVVASLGPEGLLAATREGRWRATPPTSVLSGLVEHLPWPDRLARAVALSAATVQAPVAGEFDRGVYEELLGRVAVSGEVSAA
jgi:tagatose 6-phosphate kinase